MKLQRFLLQELVLIGYVVSRVIDLVTQQTVSNTPLTANIYTQTCKRILLNITLITFIYLSIYFHTGLISAFASVETGTNKFKWINEFLWLNQNSFQQLFTKVRVFVEHSVLQCSIAIICKVINSGFNVFLQTISIHGFYKPRRHAKYDLLNLYVFASCQHYVTVHLLFLLRLQNPYSVSVLCMPWSLINKKLCLFGHVSGGDQNVNIFAWIGDSDETKASYEWH